MGCGPAGLGRALALLVLLAAQAAAQASPTGFGQRSERLERALEGSRAPLELRRRLAGLDASELPALFLLSAEGFLPGPVAGVDAHLGAEERQLVHEVLLARPRRELIALLTDLAAVPLSRAQRVEGLRLLAGMGSGDHLRLVVRLAQPQRDGGLLAPELRDRVQDAVAAILARDPGALAVIPLILSESPPAISSAVVEAVAGLRTAEAMRLLAGQLGRSPGLDALLLARLAQFGDLRRTRDEAVFDSIRRYLSHRDPGLVCAAALACGSLRDDGSVEALVGLIEHPEERVRLSAFGALASISGLAHGTEAARWTGWYHAEMRWWDEEANSLLVRVERGRGLEFVRAAREVLEHRLFRDRMAESFALALSRAEPEEARLACRALELLRSHAGVPALVECLERDDPELRQAAWRALRAITGVELPPESDSWAELAQ